jgi:NAD(P)-dependent dehydrogenase (short-subunit alcohol dehydrogenase family)
MKLDGNVAIVSGGAGGLGSAAVRDLVRAGATVVIADRNADRGGAIAAELGDSVVAVTADVTAESDVEQAIDVAKGLGTIRVLVNAHGAGGAGARIVDKKGAPAPLAHFQDTLANYLVGSYNMLRLGAAAMAATEPDEESGCRGVIINTASIAGYEGQIGQTAYAAAKSGVIGMTLVAARDLASHAIRVVTIAPGTMFTPAYGLTAEQAQEVFGQTVPFPKRMGRPDEYAALVRHICENDYLNGETIRLDGALRFGPR